MFSGATPRDAVASPRDAGKARSVPCPDNALNADLERIFRNKLGGRVLYEALLMGVEGAVLGNDRVQTCEARQRDAEATLVRLEDMVHTLAEDSVVSADGNGRGRNGRGEATLNWVLASIDMFQKAIAALEAHELLARRACRGYTASHASRLSAYETGSAPTPPSTPRMSPRMCPGGIPREVAKGTASFMELHLQAAKLQTKAEERLQDFRPRRPLETWGSWFFSSVCAACTTRQGEADHSASVVDIVNSMQLRALQAEKGDILCCTPIYVDLDGVRYRSGPEQAGRVLPLAVKRGEKVPVKGRTGDWIWNSKGYLPLRHPGDGSVLFLFDHKRPPAEDDGSEDSSGAEAETKTALTRLQRTRKPNAVKLMRPNLQGAPPPSLDPATGLPRLHGGAPPPLDLSNGKPKIPEGQQDLLQEERSTTEAVVAKDLDARD